jgi:hypothetical protein
MRTKIDYINAIDETQISAANLLGKIEHHAAALETCAYGMEANGLGGHPTHGHVAVLRHMAACLRADAAHGKLPSVYRDADRLHATAESRFDPQTAAILNALRKGI